MMSDLDNLDIMKGGKHINPTDRGSANSIERSTNHYDILSNSHLRRNSSQENYFRYFILKKKEFVKGTGSLTRRERSQMTLMSMMHSNNNRAIRSAVAERVISETQYMVTSLSSRNRVTESGS